MRFVDSNIFIHALLKPRRKLTSDEAEIKAAAKFIIKKIEDGKPHRTGGGSHILFHLVRLHFSKTTLITMR